MKTECNELISYFNKKSLSAVTPEEKALYTAKANKVSSFMQDLCESNRFNFNTLDLNMMYDTDSFEVAGDDSSSMGLEKHNLAFVNFNFGKIYNVDNRSQFKDEIAIYYNEDFPFDFTIQNRSDLIPEKKDRILDVEGEVETITLTQSSRDFHITANITILGVVK